MKRTKKFVSLLLTLAMVLTMIPAISLVFTEKARAYSSYSKSYSTEYYYASGTKFIYQLILYFSSSSNDAASSWLSSNGWTDWSGNFNAGDGHSSKYVHSGYKTTTDPTVAIKGILVADGHPSSVSYGGATYYAVGSGSITQTPTGGDGCVDLNKGNGGDDLYLMATADRAAGPALTSITKSQSGNSGTAQNNLTNNGYRIVTDQSGNYQDTNAGAGGDYNYCGQKSSCSTVDSNTLRSNYAALLTKYNQISYYNYPSTTKANIEAALTNASNVLSDLNDGYTTYSQSTINSYASNCSTQAGYMTPKAPVISRTTTVRDGVAGYYAYAYVDTNGGAPINRVQFPTWTSLNGQDDIQSDWSNNTAARGTSGSWTVNGSTYNYRYYVAVSSHNNEYAGYNTHIYAYNNLGASTSSSANFGTFTYPVSYAGNGATGGSASAQTVTYGAPTSIKNNGFTRSYTVSYNGNGGTPSKTSDTATYNFTGWNGSTSTQGYLINDATQRNGTGGSSSYTDFASWTIANPFVSGEEYTLEFDAYGSGTLTNYFYGASGYLNVAKAVSSNGATSTGGDGSISATMTGSWVHYKIVWTLGSNGNPTVNKIVLFRAMQGTSNVIHVKNVKFYQSKFVDGSNMLNLSTSGTYTMTAQWSGGGVTLPGASRTGYTFNGWYSAASGGTKYGNANASYTATANTSMTAQWTPITYTVTYHGNNNTGGSTASSTHTYDTAKNLTSNGYTRAFTVTYNYKDGRANTSATATASFDGWSTTTTGSVVYTNGQSVKNLSSTQGANINLYAKWTDASVTLPTPTRTGYIFGGWYLNDQCTGTRYSGGTAYTPTENKTLFAKWTPNQYNVTFDGNGATSGSMAAQQFTYDAEQNLNANAFSRSYTVTYNGNEGTPARASDTAAATFNGWATSATGAKVYNNGQSVKNLAESGTFPLYANWTNASVTLPTATREGYDFDGWYTEATGGAKVGNAGASYTPAANGTLYAHWSVHTYNVTFTADGTGYTCTAPAASAPYGGSVSFTVTLADGYTGSAAPAVTASTGSVTSTKSGNTVTYTVSGITGETAITVGAATADTYTITYNVDGITSTADYTIESAGKLPAEEKTGYEFKGWAVSDNAGNWTETTNLPADTALAGRWGNVTLTAQWEAKTYAITYTIGDGADTEDAPLSVQYDGSYVFTVTLDDAHDQTIPTVTATNAEVSQTVSGKVIRVTLRNITGPVTIDVPLTLNTYTLTINGDEGFTSEDNAKTVSHGDTLTFTVTLSEGYTQNAPSVTVNGAAQSVKTVSGNDYTYEIENVTDDITVDVSATKNTYAVTFTADAGADAPAAQTVTHGEDASFSVTPKTGYTQTSPVVTVNGEALAAASVTGGTYNYVIPAVKEAKAVAITTTLNTYTVTWKDENGTELEVDGNVPHGAEPSFDCETPIKAADVQYTYTFKEWSPALAEVTADVTYTATYDAVLNKYTVTFVDEDDSVIMPAASYDYGTTADEILKPADPTKPATAQFTYTFAGWTPSVASVTDNVTYKATYSATVNKYSVTFMDEDGETVLLPAAYYDYGTQANQIATPDDPTKAATAQYTYTFDGWDEEITEVTSDVIYTATYKATLNKYTVTFVDEDGETVLKEATEYDYGTAAAEIATPTDPVKAADAQYTYAFAGWNPAIDDVTDNATYTAAYSSTVNQYPVTFLDEDGAVLKDTVDYDYGTVPAEIDVPADPTKEATQQYTYAFAGWSPALATVTDAAVYTAVYDETVNQYTVTFVDEDGSVIKAAEAYDYGTPADQIIRPDDPTKAATAQFTYTFAGWGEIAPVTEDVTYTASYTATLNSYDISFYNYNNDLLDRQTLDYGVMPAYAGATPVKPADAQYTYTFKEWDPAVATVTDAAEYTAVFENTVNSYTVKFVNWDGEVLQEETLDYGATPVYKADDPVKEANAEFTYSFTGWDKEIADVTGDETYTAMFDNITNSYTVKFVNWDGALLQEETLDYGELPEYKGETPKKASDAQYSYTFDGWDATIGLVTGEATYTATYSAGVITYEITFLDEDGETVLDSQLLPYGANPVYGGKAPVKAADAELHYTFAGWGEINPVAGAATYTASYTAASHEWGDGTVTLTPTCCATGAKLFTCSGCGLTRTEVLDRDPDNHVGGLEVRGKVSPTEDADGYSGDSYCKGCGELLELGHNLRSLKGYCPYCGGYHDGLLGIIITAVHGIVWLFRNAFFID